MLSSPTICQSYVARILEPIRVQYLQAYSIHYMDDILCAAKTEELAIVFSTLKYQFDPNKLVVAPEKIQTSTPCSY